MYSINDLIEVVADKNTSYMAKWIGICYMLGMDIKTIRSMNDVSKTVFYRCLRENPSIQQLLGVNGFSITNDDSNDSTNDVYGYVYMIRNITNGKIYIGQHKGSTFDSSYYGSGMEITRAIKELGKENFTQKVLKWCHSKDELDTAEAKLIKMFEATNPSIGYNVKDEITHTIRKEVNG